MNFIALSAETSGTLRDENGVPVEWTLLRIGENPICQEGRDEVYFGPYSTHPEDEEALISYKFYLRGLKKSCRDVC